METAREEENECAHGGKGIPKLQRKKGREDHGHYCI